MVLPILARWGRHSTNPDILNWQKLLRQSLIQTERKSHAPNNCQVGKLTAALHYMICFYVLIYFFLQLGDQQGLILSLFFLPLSNIYRWIANVASLFFFGGKKKVWKFPVQNPLEGSTFDLCGKEKVIATFRCLFIVNGGEKELQI